LPSNGFGILLRVNLRSAGEAREPDATARSSNSLLDGAWLSERFRSYQTKSQRTLNQESDHT
jgi:hypothetical protein